MELADKEKQIIDHYGVMPQLKYFQSEVFELNEAIIKREDKTIELFTYDYRQKLLDNIAEEIADVQLMLNQFKEYYSISSITIDRIMNEKADRQLGRIQEEESEELTIEEAAKNFRKFSKTLEEDKEIKELNLDADALKGDEIVRTIDYLLESKINSLVKAVNELKKGK